MKILLLVTLIFLSGCQAIHDAYMQPIWEARAEEYISCVNLWAELEPENSKMIETFHVPQCDIWWVGPPFTNVPKPPPTLTSWGTWKEAGFYWAHVDANPRRGGRRPDSERGILYERVNGEKTGRTFTPD